MEVNLIYFEEAHHHKSIRNVAVELVEEMFRTVELPGSNLSFHTYYPEFRLIVFSQSLLENSRATTLQIRP
jgi:hypothetical protein